VKQVLECGFLWMGAMSGAMLRLVYASLYMGSNKSINFGYFWYEFVMYNYFCSVYELFPDFIDGVLAS
jgi:hypothetical protein